MFPDLSVVTNGFNNGVGNGVADDAPALGSADTVGPAILPGPAPGFSGRYRIRQNLTLWRPVIPMPGAVLAIDDGVTVNFNAQPVAGSMQGWIEGNGAVFNRNTQQLFPEWWFASPYVWSGSFINKMIAAAGANLVPIHFSQGYPIEEGIAIPAEMSVTSSADAALNGGPSSTCGVRILTGQGTRQQLPQLGAFADYALRIEGVQQGEVSSHYIAASGDAVVMEMVHGLHNNLCGMRLNIGTIGGCGRAYRMKGDHADNVAQANRIYSNFIDLCTAALMLDAPDLAMNGWDGNAWNFDSVDPAGGADARLLLSNIASLSRMELNVACWLGGFTHASAKYIEGAINGLHGRLTFVEQPDSYDKWALTGMGNRLELVGDNGQALTPIAAMCNANSRAGFGAAGWVGKPVYNNRMKIRATLPTALAAGASRAFYVYHMLADASDVYDFQPISMNGFVIDGLYRGGFANEIVVVVRNTTQVAKPLGTAIDFYLNVGLT